MDGPAFGAGPSAFSILFFINREIRARRAVTRIRAQNFLAPAGSGQALKVPEEVVTHNAPQNQIGNAHQRQKHR